MRSVLFLVVAIELLCLQVTFAGDGVGNGGGIGEKNLLIALSKMEQILSDFMVSQTSDTPESKVLEQILSGTPQKIGLRDFLKKFPQDDTCYLCQFVKFKTGSEYPFIQDKGCKSARTAHNLGDTIYINSDHLYEDGNPIPATKSAGILVDELAHQTGFAFSDHSLLDRAASLVEKFLNGKFIQLNTRWVEFNAPQFFVTIYTAPEFNLTRQDPFTPPAPCMIGDVRGYMYLLSGESRCLTREQARRLRQYQRDLHFRRAQIFVTYNPEGTKYTDEAKMVTKDISSAVNQVLSCHQGWVTKSFQDIGTGMRVIAEPHFDRVSERIPRLHLTVIPSCGASDVFPQDITDVEIYLQYDYTKYDYVGGIISPSHFKAHAQGKYCLISDKTGTELKRAPSCH